MFSAMRGAGLSSHSRGRPPWIRTRKRAARARARTHAGAGPGSERVVLRGSFKLTPQQQCEMQCGTAAWPCHAGTVKMKCRGQPPGHARHPHPPVCCCTRTTQPAGSPLRPVDLQTPTSPCGCPDGCCGVPAGGRQRLARTHPCKQALPAHLPMRKRRECKARVVAPRSRASRNTPHPDGREDHPPPPTTAVLLTPTGLLLSMSSCSDAMAAHSLRSGPTSALAERSRKLSAPSVLHCGGKPPASALPPRCSSSSDVRADHSGGSVLRVRGGVCVKFAVWGRASGLMMRGVGCGAWGLGCGACLGTWGVGVGVGRGCEGVRVRVRVGLRHPRGAASSSSGGGGRAAMRSMVVSPRHPPDG